MNAKRILKLEVCYIETVVLGFSTVIPEKHEINTSPALIIFNGF